MSDVTHTAPPSGERSPAPDVPFWELVNLERPLERRGGAMACLVFALSYAVVAVLRFQPGDEVWPRLAVVAYAVLGALTARHATIRAAHVYITGLALVLPLSTAYISAVSDPGMAGVLFVGLMIVIPMPFMPTARSALAVAPLLLLGLWYVPGPTGGLPVETLRTLWAGCIAFGISMALSQLAHRNQVVVVQRALDEALCRAEQGAAVKASFLAQMSHEIRTPMNGVVGISEMLAREDLPPRAAQYVTTLRGSASLLRALLDDILDTSRLETGQMTLERVPFDPVELVRSVGALFEGAADSRGLQLSTEVGEGVPARVAGDPTRLRQVLCNFVSNALKFTENGKVTLRLESSESGLTFAVQDTGIGIAAEQQEAVFGLFRQADTSIARRFGGSGLGLHISSELVRLMGSHIRIQSALGEGSTFSFCVGLQPVAEEGPEDAASLAPSAPAGLRVLVTDDNEVNCMVAEATLSALGHDASTASSGRAALEALQNEAFDVLLLDLEMPELDGFATLDLLRKHDNDQVNSIPVVALTAHALAVHRERALQSGMQGYLEKPFEAQDLERVLASVLSPAA